MTAPTVTQTQWLALDATRAKESPTVKARAAWESDVVEIVTAQADVTRAVAKRAIADMQRAGFLDRNDWRVWLTEKGRAFMEDGNTEGY